MSSSKTSSGHSGKGKKPKQSHPRGLVNLGNTCYFNAAIQPLCHTHVLHTKHKELELEKSTHISRFTVLHSFKEMCQQMRNGEKKSFLPEELRKQFIKRVERFADNRQHDSHECLRHFLNELRKDEREANSPSGETDLLTAVDKVFGGHLITVYICDECGKYYHLFEPCLDISLPVFLAVDKDTADDISCYQESSVQRITQQMSTDDEEETTLCPPWITRNTAKKAKYEKSRNSVSHCENAGHSTVECQESQQHSEARDGHAGYKHAIKKLMTRLSPTSSNSLRGLKPINLSHCLNHFSRAEWIHEEYLCTDCLNVAMGKGEASEENLKLTTAIKQTLIFNPPAVLTIHFKRFELLQGGAKKRSDKVKYPEFLDIAPYCSAECLRNYSQRKNIWYSLYAVVVHSGGSLDFGHYVAYVKLREPEESTRILKKFLQQKSFLHNATCDDVISMMASIPRKERTARESPNRDESNWYLLNDSTVRMIKRKKVLKQKAYLLFYERADDPDVPQAPYSSITSDVSRL